MDCNGPFKVTKQSNVTEYIGIKITLELTSQGSQKQQKEN